MQFQPDPDNIVWRLHLNAPPAEVFDALDSDDGRAGFWADSAVEADDVIGFEFANGMGYRGSHHRAGPTEPLLGRLLRKHGPLLFGE